MEPFLRKYSEPLSGHDVAYFAFFLEKSGFVTGTVGSMIPFPKLARQTDKQTSNTSYRPVQKSKIQNNAISNHPYEPNKPI